MVKSASSRSADQQPNAKTFSWENLTEETISFESSRKAPIQLQTHGGEIRWRNIYVRELSKEESEKIQAKAKTK